MMTFYINAHAGRHSLVYSSVRFTRTEADAVASAWPNRIGVWRVRPKTRRAFEELHLRACM
jgi:hypothetical protein